MMSKNSERLIKGDHYITSPFGGRISPITGKYEGHLGTDYGTNGQKIPCYALEDGYIHIAHYAKSVGNYVFCEFPKLGMVGDYQHLDSFSVKEGEYVKKGQEIGIIGTTGDSTGVHLHFGLFPTEDFNKDWFQKRWVDFESYKLIDIVEPEPENINVDQLKIECDDTMYCRETPNGNILGLTKKGYYTILETSEEGGYVWCKIGTDNWVAVLEPYSKYVFKALEEENNENSINIPTPTETPLETPKNEYRYEIWTDKKKIELIKDTSLYNYETNEVIKNYKQGSTIKNIIGICYTKNEKYYITEYSFNNSKNTGFKIEECNLYEYETIDIYPKLEKDTLINLIRKIIEIIKKILKVGE